MEGKPKEKQSSARYRNKPNTEQTTEVKETIEKKIEETCEKVKSM
jgi:hypothetical protein